MPVSEPIWHLLRATALLQYTWDGSRPDLVTGQIAFSASCKGMSASCSACPPTEQAHVALLSNALRLCLSSTHHDGQLPANRTLPHCDNCQQQQMGGAGYWLIKHRYSGSIGRKDAIDSSSLCGLLEARVWKQEIQTPREYALQWTVYG